MDNNNKQIYSYTVLLEKESDGGYHAFCPVLKGCHSQGDSFEEAIENITEAIELYIEDRTHLGIGSSAIAVMYYCFRDCPVV
ncbi:type II toxin-antitoxin system HicB family antitoxin [Phormidesmis sp. 146-12]